jgi:hypothetical protein
MLWFDAARWAKRKSDPEELTSPSRLNRASFSAAVRTAFGLQENLYPSGT